MKLIMMAAALHARRRRRRSDDGRDTATTTMGQTVAPGNTSPETRRPRHPRHLGARGRSGRLQPAAATVPAGTPHADRCAADADQRRAAAALHPHRHRPLHPDLRARPRTLRAGGGAALSAAPIVLVQYVCHEPSAFSERKDANS